VTISEITPFHDVVLHAQWLQAMIFLGPLLLRWLAADSLSVSMESNDLDRAKCSMLFLYKCLALARIVLNLAR